MSFNPSISTVELKTLSESLELRIQHECSGYRIVDKENRDIFPADGVCPTVARLACYIFLLGVKYGIHTLLVQTKRA